MTGAELIKLVARVRHAIPRNALVEELCVAAESLAPMIKEPFDKKVYQRDYMRDRRAKAKKEGR